MKILFMGTPDFAVPCLEALLQSGHEVCGAVTQPDKPKGRGHKLQPTPVKECALAHNIPVFQPAALKDGAFTEIAAQLAPDIIIVVAYGKLLPKDLLVLPPLGCVNVHASLLPKYRGAGPIQWSVINGEKETGITTMYMGEGLDTGDMLLQRATEIQPEETASELHDRLAVIGAELLLKTLTELENGTAQRIPQDDTLATYAPMISKQTGHIDWTKPAQEIVNLIRGCNSWPIAYTIYNGEPLKIIRATVGEKTDKPAGALLGVQQGRLAVAAGDGTLVLVSELQFPGSKRMSVESYLNGHTIDMNQILN